MQVKITPSPLAGTVQLPPSKSFAIRALICSALSGGGSVAPLGTSADIAATVQALADLAAGRGRNFLQRKRLFGALFDPGGGSFGQVGNLYRRRTAARRPLDAICHPAATARCAGTDRWGPALFYYRQAATRAI